MILEEGTQLIPTADTQLATLDALRALLAKHPGLPALDWRLHVDRPGYISVCIEADARVTVEAFHALFGGHTLTGKPSASAEGMWTTSHTWFGVAGGLDFYLFGTDPVAAPAGSAAAA